MGEESSSWANVKTFDDVVIPEDRRIISNLERGTTVRCPHLRREGEFFHYCWLNLREAEDKTPSPNNPIYQRHVSTAELQWHCMGNFETCCFYSGTL